jgi:hypothetical protein
MTSIQRPETKVNVPADTCNSLVLRNLTDLVAERKIKRGMLSLNIARHIYPKSRTGDEMKIAGATFVIGK